MKCELGRSGMDRFRKSRGWHLVAAFAVAALVAGIAGCGGSKDKTTSATVQEQVADHRVTLDSGVVILADRQMYLDRLKSESVRWINPNDEGCTIVFSHEGWPFQQPPQFIFVPGRDSSAIFNVLPSTTNQLQVFSYTVYRMGLADTSSTLPLGKQTDPKPKGPPNTPEMDVGP
jgi:hypothetical protein